MPVSNLPIFVCCVFVPLQPESGVGDLIVEVSRLHVIRHTHTHTHTSGRAPLKEWSACREGSYLHNRKQTQETNIRALMGFGTRDPSNQAASDLRRRPHGHWNRFCFNL